jgi:hypothetical protein
VDLSRDRSIHDCSESGRRPGAGNDRDRMILLF